MRVTGQDPYYKAKKNGGMKNGKDLLSRRL